MHVSNFIPAANVDASTASSDASAVQKSDSGNGKSPFEAVLENVENADSKSQQENELANLQDVPTDALEEDTLNPLAGLGLLLPESQSFAGDSSGVDLELPQSSVDPTVVQAGPSESTDTAELLDSQAEQTLVGQLPISGTASQQSHVTESSQSADVADVQVIQTETPNQGEFLLEQGIEAAAESGEGTLEQSLDQGQSENLPSFGDEDSKGFDFGAGTEGATFEVSQATSVEDTSSLEALVQQPEAPSSNVTDARELPAELSLGNDGRILANHPSSVESRPISGIVEAQNQSSTLPATQVAAAFSSRLTSFAEEPLQTLSVELQPAELGHLKITIEQIADQSLVANIVASELVSVDLLMQEKNFLQESLEELGFGETSVDISHENSRERHEGNHSPETEQTIEFPVAPGLNNTSPVTPSQRGRAGINVVA